MNVMRATQSTSFARSTTLWLAMAVGSAVFSACGGGGSASADTAAAAGVGNGTVTGFGSIVVDGVHYDDRKVVLGVDTPANAPDAPAPGASVEIKLGHHVEVTFTGSESSSAATSVVVSAEVVGNVSAIAPDLVVAGQTVKANSVAANGPVTFFEGFLALNDIKVGDRVEVHGTPTAAGVIQATRIERESSRDTWVRISGNVGSLGTSSFVVGGETINFDANTKVFPVGTSLANAQRVAVWSDTPAVGSVVSAKFIRIKKTAPGTDTAARVAGAITDCVAVCDASFKVGGIVVNAATAEFVNGVKADLANGKWVELRGTVDLTTGAIKATRVSFRKLEAGKPDVSLKGAITDFVDGAHFKVRGVAVTTDSATVTTACTAALAQGTLVSIGGGVANFTVLAKTVDCLNSPEGISLEGKGRITAVDPVAKTFKLDGTLFSSISLSYAGAEFASGTSATSLTVGATVVVRGSVTAGVVTVTRIGLADELAMSTPGIIVLEAEGVASHVTFTGAVVTGFAIDGLTFGITTESVVRTLDGALIDGARIHVLFKKAASGANVVLLVNTKH